MDRQKQKRKRGVILTPEGLQQLQHARRDLEAQENFGERYTLEALCDRTGLDLHTVKRVLTCRQGVDKRTLERYFAAFNLELSDRCYTSPNPNKRQDWGEAMCVAHFYGRTEELATLEQWLLRDRCRLVTLLGMGGIGKTCLSIRLGEQVQDKFDCVIWRSLKDSPPVKDILTNLIQFLSNEQETEADLPKSLGGRISRLLEYLRASRCLAILDNAETILRSSSRAGEYLEGYEGYGELIKRLGEADHASCLLLTSREKPKEVASMEGENLPVRSLRLSGLKQEQGKQILAVKGLVGSEAELTKLVEHYCGNALALKVIATTILEVFDGNISAFRQQDTAVFGDIGELLAQQFERLSDLEHELMYWLAINREPVTLSQLQEEIVSAVSYQKLLEALESLSRRSLIEKQAPRFTLQPVVMEYATQQFIERVCEEIVAYNLKLFRRHALMKATAKDYIRETQIRLIRQPIIDKLLAVLKGKKNLENQLTRILAVLQETSPLEPGYTGGNILNLLCHLGTDLRGYDFSHLCVWQADLRNTCLHQVSFQNAELAKSVFSETFGSVLSVAFSPNGELLAAGDSSGDIHLWKVADGQQLLIFRGHANWVVSLVFSSDGKTLASGSSDNTMKLWEVGTGQCLKTLQEHDGEVWAVAFNPNGDLLASGSDDQTLRLWRVSTGECLRVFRGHTGWVTSVAFSGDGKTLASSSDDHTVKLWDSTGECLKTFEGHSDGVRSIALSPDGQKLASGSEDHTVKLWETSTGECLKTFEGHTNRIFSVAFSPQGNYLASGSHDRTTKLWDINKEQALRTFQEHSNEVFSVAFSPQGDLIASGSRDQTVKLWSVSSGRCLRTFQGCTNQILSVAFSPDCQTLASGSHDRTVRLWDVNTGQVLKTFRGHANWVYSVAFSLQGNFIASGSGDKTVKLWEASTGRALRTFQGHRAAVWSVVFSPDGQRLASSSEDHTIRVWDIHTGQVLGVLQGHRAAVWSLAFSPDGDTLVSGAWDQKIKLWKVGTGECLKTLEGHTSWVWSVAFSPDGDRLASTSPDGTLRLWKVDTGECQRILETRTGWLLSVAFSPDGQTLASSSQDCTIKLWDVNTDRGWAVGALPEPASGNSSDFALLAGSALAGRCTADWPRTLSGHKGGYIWSVAFCSNSQILASGSEDETIKLWDVRIGKCLRTLKTEKLYECLSLTGATGLTEATRATLKALGAVD